MSTVGEVQVADQIRLFMAPGVRHCAGGEGPWQVDYLRATFVKAPLTCKRRTRFTVIYRSRPAFQIVPVDDEGSAAISLADDTLYRAQPVGSSVDGRTSIDHDAISYPR
jgi:hypothetical protein